MMNQWNCWGERHFNKRRFQTPFYRPLTMENLEERDLLTVAAGKEILTELTPASQTHIVTTLNDIVDESDRYLSLREAIAKASSGDTIQFESTLSGGTISLAEGELKITVSLTIDASPLSGAITIDAHSESRVFNISVESAVVSLKKLKITGGKVNNYGGGINNLGTLNLTEVTISSNSANWGGGIYNKGTVTIDHSTITNNTASARGGGIHNISKATVEMNLSFLTKNTADNNYGGGISNEDGTVTIKDSEITGNSCKNGTGGGIYHKGGSFKVYGGTIAGNSAKQDGGGIYNYQTSEISLYNTIIVKNNAASEDDIYCSEGSGKVNGYYCLSGFNGWSTVSESCLTYDDSKPLFTDGYRLAAGSQAINGGNNNYKKNETDLAGNTRIEDGVIDIGAYEAQKEKLRSITLSTDTPKVGLSITATLSPSGATADYQWFRIDDNGNETAIPDATSSLYTVSKSDLGYYLKIKATGKENYSGTVYNQTTSKVTMDLTAIKLSETELRIGTQITTTLSPSGATASYQWYRVSAAGTKTAISGATSSSYTIAESDLGYYLRVTATGTGDYLGSVSAKTASYVMAPLTGIRLSTKTAEVGTQITTTLSPSGATASYQWYRVDSSGVHTAISGAVLSSYTAAAEDVGYFLKAVAVGSGAYYETVSASTTSQVTAPLKSITLSETSPGIGTVITTTLLPAGASAAYQWYRIDESGTQTAISGATASSYTVSSSDLGYYLKVVAAGTGCYWGAVSAATVSRVKTSLTRITLSNTAPNVGTEITTTLYPKDAGASYQWYRVNAAGEETAISGAVSSRYTAVFSDVGYYLKVTARGTGSYAGSVSAMADAPVTAYLTDVSLSDESPCVGTKITASVSPDGASARYAWYRVSASGAETAISGAASSSYTAVAADVGYYLKVVAQGAGDYLGNVSKMTSCAVTIPLSGVTLSTDIPQLGSVLTASLSPAAATASYQWYRVSESGAQIAVSGATSSSYTVTKSDAGYYLQVTAAGKGIYSGSVSAKTASPLAVSLTGVYLSVTTPLVGITLAATLVPSEASASYQWYRVDTAGNQTAILNASSARYTVTESDVGYFMKVRVTGKNGYVGSLEAMTVSAVPESTQLPAPVNVTLSSSRDNIYVAWESVANADSYLVAYSTSEQFNPFYYEITSQTDATLKNLTAGSIYYVKVQAMDSTQTRQDSDFSEVQSIKAGGEAEPLAIPTGLSYASWGANRARLTWNAVENAVGYSVSYSADGTAWSMVTSSSTAVTVTGLTYGKLYAYKVRALAAEGGDYSDSDDSAAISYRVCPMDINSDGKINIADYSLFSRAYLSGEGDAKYDARCNINGVGKINIADWPYLNQNFGKKSDDASLVYPAALAALPEDDLGWNLDFVEETLAKNSLHYTLDWELDLF